MGAGREAGEGSPELLLLRQEGCPAGLWPRNKESPSRGQPGLGEATGQNCGGIPTVSRDRQSSLSSVEFCLVTMTG